MGREVHVPCYNKGKPMSRELCGYYGKICYKAIRMSVRMSSLNRSSYQTNSYLLSILFSAAVGYEQESDADYCGDGTVDGPADLAGHETAGEDVDALQDPDCARQNHED